MIPNNYWINIYEADYDELIFKYHLVFNKFYNNFLNVFSSEISFNIDKEETQLTSRPPQNLNSIEFYFEKDEFKGIILNVNIQSNQNIQIFNQIKTPIIINDNSHNYQHFLQHFKSIQVISGLNNEILLKLNLKKSDV
jgi:hypothetical protein